MPAIVTESFRIYWNHQVQGLSRGTVVTDPEFADYLLTTGAPVEQVSEGPAVDTDGDGVPDGTIAQVLEWVGTDHDKATKALDAERGKGDKARTTVVTALEKLLST